VKPVLHHGYHVAEWRKSGMRAWAVSDLGRDELDQFAQLLKARE
jgi:anti-sigma factor RsiW